MNQPIRIVVIDDEQNVADALWHLLRMHQYEVLPFTSAREALAAMAQISFDVVISDLQMADMDGLAFLTQVASEHPLARRMLITAYDSTSLREQMEGIVQAYLPKPFSLQSFIQVVNHQVAAVRQAALLETGDWQSQRLLHKIGAQLMDRAWRQTLTNGRSLMQRNDETNPKVREVYTALEAILGTLQNAVQADLVFVANTIGQMIVEVGASPSEEQVGLIPFISATFASIAELGNLVDGQSDAGAFWYREGVHFDLYMVTINRNYYVAAFMGKSEKAIKPGMAWIALKRAVGALRSKIELEFLPFEGSGEVEPVLASAIVNDLDDLFANKSMS